MGNMIADALGGLLSKAGGIGLNNSAINNALNVYSSLKGNPDYMKALESMAQSNSQIANALNYINQNGGDSKSAFMKLAQQNGIDPNTILNLIK